MSYEILLRDYRIIFIDFDGVIKDSLGIKGEAFKSIFQKYGNDVSQKIFNHHMTNGGISRNTKIPIYIEFTGQIASKKLVDQYLTKFSTTVCEKVIACKWIPGAENFLKNNKFNHKFILITATPQKEIEYILKELKIYHLFEHIYGNPSEKKTSIESYVKKNKVSKDSCLVIGDSKVDYEAAVYNKISFLLINNEYDSLRINKRSKITVFNSKNFLNIH